MGGVEECGGSTHLPEAILSVCTDCMYWCVGWNYETCGVVKVQDSGYPSV